MRNQVALMKMNRFFNQSISSTMAIVVIGISLISCNKLPSENVAEHILEEEVKDTSVILTDLNETPVDLSSFKGKTVFLNFWATWCKPCIAEMPSIERAQDILKNDSIVFLLASNEPLDKIKKFKVSQNFNLNFIRLASPLENLDIIALPTTHIIAPTGETIFSEMGGRAWDNKQNIELLRNINATQELN